MVDVIEMSQSTMPVGKLAFWPDEVEPLKNWRVDVRYFLAGVKDKNKKPVLFSNCLQFGGSSDSTKGQIIERVKRWANDYQSPGSKKIKTCYITGFHPPCFGADFEYMQEVVKKMNEEIKMMTKAVTA